MCISIATNKQSQVLNRLLRAVWAETVVNVPRPSNLTESETCCRYVHGRSLASTPTYTATIQAPQWQKWKQHGSLVSPHSALYQGVISNQPTNETRSYVTARLTVFQHEKQATSLALFLSPQPSCLTTLGNKNQPAADATNCCSLNGG